MPKTLCAALVLLITQTVMATAPFFQGLGDLPGGGEYGWAQGVSADGSIAVGLSYSENSIGYEAFRWENGVIEGLGDLPGGDFWSGASSISGNGQVIVGASSSALASYREAFRWTAQGGMVGLGALATGPGKSSAANGVSGDGSVIVGSTSSPNTTSFEAFRWTESSGMVGLGDLPGGQFRSGANSVSPDGRVVVGQGNGVNGPEAFRWTQETGMIGLGDLSGGLFSSVAYAVSDDGNTVVGYGYGENGTPFGDHTAFRWTESGGMVSLGALSNACTGQDLCAYSEAFDVSADGTVVVGQSRVETGNTEAYIWDQANGMRRISSILEDDLGIDLGGWRLLTAYGVSSDGLTVVGHGFDPNGNVQGWIAHVPEPSTGIFILSILAPMALRRIRRG